MTVHRGLVFLALVFQVALAERAENNKKSVNSSFEAAATYSFEAANETMSGAALARLMDETSWFVRHGAWSDMFDPSVEPKLLGAGTFGVASLVKMMDDCGGTNIVLKSIDMAKIVAKGMSPTERSVMEDTANELSVQNLLGTHPNLMAVFDFYPRRVKDWPSRNAIVYLLLPVASGGDADKNFKKNTMDKGKDWTYANLYLARMALDLTRGLANMHRRGYVHKDIKPGNAWAALEDCGTVGGPAAPECKFWLGDFGLTKIHTDPQMPQAAGTPPYMPPEVPGSMSSNAYPYGYKNGWSFKGDCFSLGLTFLAVLSHITDAANFPAGVNMGGQWVWTPGTWEYDILESTSADDMFRRFAMYPGPKQSTRTQIYNGLDPMLKELFFQLTRPDVHQRLDSQQAFDMAKAAFTNLLQGQDLPNAPADTPPQCVNLCKEMQCCSGIRCMFDHTAQATPKVCLRDDTGNNQINYVANWVIKKAQNVAIAGGNSECQGNGMLHPSLKHMRPQPVQPHAPSSSAPGYQPNAKINFFAKDEGQWQPCRVSAVDARTGAIQINYNGQWVSVEEQAKYVQPRKSAPTPHQGAALYAVGSPVKYYSQSYGQWADTVVERVDAATGNIMIPLKPDFWITFALQKGAIRPATYNVGDQVAYKSTSLKKWVPCKVARVSTDFRIVVDCKAGVWISLDDQLQIVAPLAYIEAETKEEEVVRPSKIYMQGDSVMFMSVSAGAWIPCRVTKTDSSYSIELDCKPGYMLSLDEQNIKVRRGQVS